MYRPLSVYAFVSFVVLVCASPVASSENPSIACKLKGPNVACELTHAFGKNSRIEWRFWQEDGRDLVVRPEKPDTFGRDTIVFYTASPFATHGSCWVFEASIFEGSRKAPAFVLQYRALLAPSGELEVCPAQENPESETHEDEKE